MSVMYFNYFPIDWFRQYVSRLSLLAKIADCEITPAKPPNLISLFPAKIENFESFEKIKKMFQEKNKG